MPTGDSDLEPPVRLLPSRPTEVVTLSDIMTDSTNVPAKTPEREKSKDSLVYICDGIPPLPAKVVQAIERGEFIDFASLLPKTTASWDEDPFTEIADRVIVFTQGKSVPKKKSIQDIETWMEAFCTYAAVRGKRHPEGIPELLAYAATIVKGEWRPRLVSI